MLVLKTLDVSTYNGQSYNLEWDFEPDVEEISDYLVNVYRSESPVDDINRYDLVVSGLSANAYSFIDTSVSQLLDLGRPWFYKLGIYNPAISGISYQPDPAAYLKDEVPDRVFREIVRRKNINLQNPRLSGRDFRVFKRRTWGTHCPDCWDMNLQRSTDSDCTTCVGTGWINGYYDPITIRGMKNTSPKLNQINMFGEWKPSDSLLYTLGYPPLKPRDIVADDNNHLWTVVQIRTVERRGYVVEQNVQIASIAQDDFLYKYLLAPGLGIEDGQISVIFSAPTIYSYSTLFVANTTNGDDIYKLPSASSWLGRAIIFKADELIGGIVKIYPIGSSKIDDFNYYYLNNPFGSVTLQSDGHNWWTV